MYILPGKALSFFHKPFGLEDSQIRELIRIIPNAIIFFVVVLSIFWFILNKTKFGQHNYAIGGSKDAALRAGINVKKHLIR